MNENDVFISRVCGSCVNTIYECKWRDKEFYMIYNIKGCERIMGKFNGVPFQNVPACAVRIASGLIIKRETEGYKK